MAIALFFSLVTFAQAQAPTAAAPATVETPKKAKKVKAKKEDEIGRAHV